MIKVKASIHGESGSLSSLIKGIYGKYVWIKKDSIKAIYKNEKYGGLVVLIGKWELWVDSEDIPKELEDMIN